MPAMSTSFDEWLRSLGFKGNPFAEREAEREKTLSEYFIAGPHYSDMLGDLHDPRTSILFADRGCGKTAYRLMIAEECRPAQMKSTVLAASYTDFDRVIDRAGGNPHAVMLAHHLEAIVAHGVTSLLEALSRNPTPFSQSPSDVRGELRALVHAYSPRALLPSRLRRRLQEIAGDDSKSIPWQSMWEDGSPGAISRWLYRTRLSENPSAHFWALLYESRDSSLPGTPRQDFQLFLELLPQLGIQGLYVLVDRLDETFALQNPATMAAFLNPLLSDLILLNQPRVGFKLFLPINVLQALQRQPRARLDRLHIFILEWNGQELRQVLQDRLDAFSNGRVQSLDALFEGASLNQMLIRYAWGCPRTLLLLADILLHQIYNTMIWQESQAPAVAKGGTKTETRKLADAMDRAVEEFRRRYSILLPLLRIDDETGMVYIGSRPVPRQPSASEFKVLDYLRQHKGEIISKDRLFDDVLSDEEGKSDEAIDSLMSRLRRKIEPDPARPMYLITVRGRGYRLERVER